MNRSSIILTIGDVSVRVGSENESFLRDLGQYYSNFVDQEPGDIAAEIHLTHQTYTYSDEIVVKSENNKYTIDGGEFKGELCLNSRIARFSMRPEASLFDSFLRVFYSILLTEYNSFLVHAAGLKKDDGAYLFSGPSSSGKTTTATIANDFNEIGRAHV